MTADFFVGEQGSGELTISAGGRVTNAIGVVGNSAGSNGAVTVTGSGTTWTHSGQFIVGAEGAGTALVEEGATVTAEGVRVGFAEGGDGELTVTGEGSSITSGQQVQIGQLSTGELVLSDGALLDSKKGTSPTSTSGIIGTEEGGTGIVVITGAGTQWVQDGGMNVGFRGTGTMVVENGGLIHSADGIIGRFPQATGTVTVSGANSTWLVDNDMHAGGIADADGGTATLHVAAGGNVSVGNLLRVWDGGTVNLSGGTLTADSIQHNDGGAFNFTGGTLHVVTFTGNLTNGGGTLAPGDPTGTTTVVGDYTQSSGALQIELASAGSYDKLVVNGNLTLGGTLSVSLVSGYSPAAGATFDILDWTNLTGTFSTLQLPPLAGSLMWNTNQLYTDGVLAVVGPGLPGDYNLNGTVDAADYVIWRKTLGQSGDDLPADGDGDGTIDTGDYDVWRTNFGRAAGAAAATSAVVPEPAAMLSLAMGIIAMIFSRRRTVDRAR
jgi:T5SS/PEP-CTERM-associated repeat protein